MKQYTMKDSIFARIQTDLVLRRKIGDFKNVEGSTIRAAAINKTDYLYDVRIIQIISDHLGIDFFDVLDSKETKVKKEKHPSLKIELIDERFIINNTRHDKITEPEKDLISRFIIYMRDAKYRNNQAVKKQK